MAEYVVKREGFILGKWANPNKVLRLDEDQARIFEREGRIEPRQSGATASKAGKGKSG